MGDFEDTFGPGADASEIIDGNSHSREWNEIKARWHRESQYRLAELERDPAFVKQMAELRARQGQGDGSVGKLTDDEQDARRRAIETMKRAIAQREAQAAARATGKR